MESKVESNSTSGLPGFKPVRATVAVTIQCLADQTGIAFHWLAKLGADQSCSVENLQKLCRALCCTPNDLLSIPSAERLHEIKVAYLRRQLGEAEAERAAS